MGNLVKEQRLDKNGKLVTRWVKPQGQGTSTSSVPAPSVAKKNDHKKALDKISQHCTSYYFEGPLFEEELPVAVRNMPADYAEKFAEQFEDEAGAHELGTDITERAILIFGPDSTIDPKARVTVLSNYMSIIPPFTDEKEDYGINAAHYARIVFEGINGYERDTLFSEDERVAITAAAEIVEYIFPVPRDEGYPNEGFIVEDKKVKLASDRGVQLLIENVGIIDQLKSVLMQRKTFHPDVIAEVASNGVLADGSL